MGYRSRQESVSVILRFYHTILKRTNESIISPFSDSLSVSSATK